MGDRVVLSVDNVESQKAKDLGAPESSGANIAPIGGQEQSGSAVHGSEGTVASEKDEETVPLLQVMECRICQEEDHVENLETPCACKGSLKYAHKKCVQRWCNEKGDITCEICHQPYQPGYTAPPPRPFSDDVVIDISEGWTISGTPLALHDPRFLAMAAAERRFLEASENDDYASTNANGAAFCRSVALILMALLLLRHALSITNSDGENEEDASELFSLFLLRVAGFLLPCYIMAWAISVIQRRRQQQEAAALAATEVAFVLQAGQRRGLQFTIAPGPTPVSRQDQV